MTNVTANVTDCGNPDYVLTEDNIPRGFIEAKDVGKDLNDKTLNKNQFDRYRKALDNLIITDYLWFQFFLKIQKPKVKQCAVLPLVYRCLITSVFLIQK